MTLEYRENPKTGLVSTAVFTNDGKYRYILERQLRKTGDRSITFVGLMPTRAGAEFDDAVVRRCKMFARGFGFDWLRVVNLYGLITDIEAGFKAAEDPIGTANTEYLMKAVDASEKIVVCWGPMARPYRAQIISDKIRARGKQLECLGMTKHGFPRSVVRRSLDAKLEPYDRQTHEKRWILKGS